MENTFVMGVSFKNADVSTRSAFSISPEKQKECYDLAKSFQFEDFIVLSTCNRTEMYGVGSISFAEQIMTTVCNLPQEFLNNYKFVKTSEDALTHIFHVASGLDSQILGDYQILGQFKDSCKVSKENGLLGPVFERMANICIQASKEIKTKTSLSKGTVSASYATIEIIQEKIGERPAKCLLIGTGKFGNNISKNIKHYLPNVELTVSNRTYATAQEVASKHGFRVLPYEDIREQLKNYEVIILSAPADNYLVTPWSLEQSKTELILDLSIPQTVDPACKALDGVEIMDIDSISAILDKSIETRKTYLPIANEIINNHITAFVDWSNFYKKRNQILSLKNMIIQASKSCPHLARMDEACREDLINKAIQGFVLNLKQNKNYTFEPQVIVNEFVRFSQAV